MLDVKSKFHPESFKAAKESLTEKKSNLQKKGVQLRSSAYAQRGSWLTLLRFLGQQSLFPTVVFCFSKRLCDTQADSLAFLDLTSRSEKSQIKLIFAKALKHLSSEDRLLPQILRIASMAVRGIAVHHAGLLTTIKETVELAMAKGLLKVLFATETLSIGINFSIKCVVFSGLRKHDGTQFRDLMVGEYAQISGRAGRRGIDTVGVVITICSELPDERQMRALLTGQASKLESKYRITYQMCVQMMRQTDMSVLQLIRSSFSEAATARRTPEYKLALAKHRQQLEALKPVHCNQCSDDEMATYTRARQWLDEQQKRCVDLMFKHEPFAQHWLCSGRLVRIRKFGLPIEIGLVLQSRVRSTLTLHICMILMSTESNQVEIDKARQSSIAFPLVVGSAHQRQYFITTIQAENVSTIYHTVLQIDPSAILLDERRHAIDACVLQLIAASDDDERALQAVPSVELIKPYRNLASAEDETKMSECELIVRDSACNACPDCESHYTALSLQNRLSIRCTQLQHLLIHSADARLVHDAQHKLSVLQKLHYIDDHQTVLIKGRLAVEVSTVHPLIAIELLQDGVFDDLSSHECAALLSCLVFAERLNEVQLNRLPILPVKLQSAIDRLSSLTLSLSRVELQCGMDVASGDEYTAQHVNTGLASCILSWSQGSSFASICRQSVVQEGTIVRSITRLVDACTDLRNASRVAGSQVSDKFQQAIQACNRDIVAAASLYTTT